MKNQALFSSKDESKKLKCHLLKFLFGVFRVKMSRSAFMTSLLLLWVKKPYHGSVFFSPILFSLVKQKRDKAIYIAFLAVAAAV